MFLNRYFENKVVGSRGGKEVTEASLKVTSLVRDLGIGLVVLILVLFLNPVTSVTTGTRGVVTNGGAITKIEPEGRHLVWFWESMTSFSIRAETAKIDNAVGGTADQQPVTTSLVVRYSIQPDKVAEVYEKYSHDGDLSSYVDSAVHETFKAVTAKFSAPDLLNKRQEVSNEVKALLVQKLATYGAQVIQVDMTKFEYDPAYQKAINDKVQQDQLLQTAQKRQLTVAAEQQSNVEIAQKAADVVRAKADGDKYAVIAESQAQAEATKLNAEAQAVDIRVRSQALKDAGVAYLDLKRVIVDQTRAEKWDGKLPEAIYASAPIPFLNLGSAAK